MNMTFDIKRRIASILAVLLATVVMNSAMNSIATADVNIVSLPQNGSEAITLKLPSDAFEAKNKDANDILQVFVGEASSCCEGRTPIAGHYKIESNLLTFTPAFGFVAGQDYVARIQMPDAKSDMVPFKIGSKTLAQDAQIIAIYPSGDVIPANALRFYIHFSTPMQPHVSSDYIKLLDADGHADEAAFMKFKQELWNEDRTRLTVLMDPGRIKRNVATNLELGPALHEGNDYSLVITDGWMPVQGKTPLKAYSKTFSAGRALRQLPNTDKWQISLPRSNTKESLEIKFDRPFDAWLLRKSIKIKTASGDELDGAVSISGHETVWSFKPNKDWQDNGISIVIDPYLEDVAGNNFNDLLDHRATKNRTKSGEIIIPIELLK